MIILPSSRLTSNKFINEADIDSMYNPREIKASECFEAFYEGAIRILIAKSNAYINENGIFEVEVY